MWFGLAGLVVSGPALSLEIGNREVRCAHSFFEALVFGLLRAASSEPPDGSLEMLGLESNSES
jgi:hypothetical protein